MHTSVALRRWGSVGGNRLDTAHSSLTSASWQPWGKQLFPHCTFLSWRFCPTTDLKAMGKANHRQTPLTRIKLSSCKLLTLLSATAITAHTLVFLLLSGHRPSSLSSQGPGRGSLPETLFTQITLPYYGLSLLGPARQKSPHTQLNKWFWLFLSIQQEMKSDKIEEQNSN